MLPIRDPIILIIPIRFPQNQIAAAHSLNGYAPAAVTEKRLKNGGWR